MINSYIEPRTADERLVAKIWEEELKRDRVGILDNFFDMEGDSLIMTQIAKRIHESFDVNITVRAIFDAPTVMALAEHIAEARAAAALLHQTRAARAIEISEGEI